MGDTEVVNTLPLHSKKGIVGHVTVDPVDWLWAHDYRWHLSNGYACRSQRRGPEGKPHRMALHREILGLKHGYPDLVGDHINGERLDCRRENLRAVSWSANAQNRVNGHGTSIHQGVSWYSAKNCWRVQIMVGGKRTLVGYFDDELKAADAARNFYSEHHPYARVTAQEARDSK